MGWDEAGWGASGFVLDGVKERPDWEEKGFRSNVCPRCDGVDLPDSGFCDRCGVVLDRETVLRLWGSGKKLGQLFLRLTEDPEKIDELLKLVKAL